MKYYRYDGKVYYSHSKETLARRLFPSKTYRKASGVVEVVRMDLVAKKFEILPGYKRRKNKK